MSMGTKNSKWFLVYTKAKEEKRAKKNLENQGFETFLPMIVCETSSQAKPISIETMFPRYLFLKMNAERDNWTNIKSTRGVSHFVTFGQQPGKVPHRVMTFLQKRADKNGIFRQKATIREFQKGEELIIKKGLFKGKEATFLSKKSKERVTILLRLLNQLITAEVSASDVGQREIIEAFKL